MMEGFLTEELLWNGLLAYLNKYELQGAEQDNLFESLTEAGKSVLPPGVTVKDIMDPWTLKSGYPIVRVTAAGSRRIYISQEKFRLNQSDPQPLELWNIPLVVVTADNPDFSKRTPDLWMKSNELLVNFPVPDTTKFVMVNPDAYGYFRVHYEPKLLTLIKGQLNSDHNVISPQTRSQLLDDYLTFALLSDYASVVSALELTHYLGKETELVVWSTVLTNLREPMNKLSGTPGFIALEHYLKPRVESALKTVETATTGASAILRASLMEWACSLGSADCITKSEDMLDAWRNDPDNLNILADIQQVVFCTGVSKKGQSELNFLISQYKRVETHEIIRLRLLNALGCVEDSTLLTVLLAAAIDPDEIREVDSTLLLQRIVSNVKGRDLGYDFITNNFAEVGAARFAAVVSTLSLHWHTDENLTKLEDFISSHQDELASVLPSLNASLANIRNNMVWVENKGKPMAEWMIAQ
jgi:aminopeptidase N